MLEYLRIRNLALIEDMELEFSPGMNVLTGETGAGKSFILKALSFLLGDKLSGDMVRANAERAQVEALFITDKGELVLKRELAADSGRSRLYINDTLSSQEILKELRANLVTYTSQHGQQQLLQPAFQARLMESALPRPELLRERDAQLAQLHDIAAQAKALREKQASLAEKRDLLEMQQQEIDKIAPREGEEDKLEELRAKVRAQEHLRGNYDEALAILHGDDGMGLLDMLGRFEKLIHHMSREDEALTPDAEAVAALRSQLAHLSNHLRRPPVLDDDADMDKIEERLFALAQLKRKLRRNLPEILALRDEVTANLSFLDVCALDISRLAKEEAALAEKLKAIVEEIAPLRRSAATAFARELEHELRDLGFSEHVRVIPDFTAHEIWPGVQDERVRVLWAPNPGQPPQPLDRIASGGELSRFLLALTGIRPNAEHAVYIFDEVDAGVGGLTLNKLAEKLDALAGKRQMLLITHWPQLAARARTHFQISKVIRDGATFTLCSPLNRESRRDELARMAGGGAQGEAVARSLE